MPNAISTYLQREKQRPGYLSHIYGLSIKVDYVTQKRTNLWPLITFGITSRTFVPFSCNYEFCNKTDLTGIRNEGSIFLRSNF